MILAIPAASWISQDPAWKTRKQKKFTLYYTSPDAGNQKEYSKLLNNGINSTEDFFGQKFKSRFNVYIHPGRASLDSTWQTDWKMPEFRSECWMVASGVAQRLDMISPKQWDKAACEHTYSDKIKTQQLITHELVHVFHGQVNASPDFSDAEGIDWLVEGLATYASGQCDSARLGEVKKAIADKKNPIALDKFWTGKFKYGFSGSMVMYIDKKYGREKLKALLPFNKKSAVLDALAVTEAGLIRDWTDFMLK